MRAELRTARGAADGIPIAREAARLGESGSSLNAACDTRVALGGLLLDTRDPVGAEAVLADACALARSAGRPQDRAQAHGLRGLAALAGRPERAVAAVIVDRFRKLEATDPMLEAAWAWALAVLGDAAGSRKRAESAQSAAAREPFSARLRVGIALGYATEARGEAYDWESLRRAVPPGLPGIGAAMAGAPWRRIGAER